MRNVALAILVIITLWSLGLVYYIYLINSYKTDRSTTDAIAVVAGGGNRIETAISLLQAGYAPILLITGITSNNQLQNLLKERNVRDEQVIYAPNVIMSEKDYAQKIGEFILSKNLTSIRLVDTLYNTPSIINEVWQLLPAAYQLRLIANPVLGQYTKFNQYKILFQSYNKYLISFW